MNVKEHEVELSIYINGTAQDCIAKIKEQQESLEKILREIPLDIRGKGVLIEYFREVDESGIWHLYNNLRGLIKISSKDKKSPLINITSFFYIKRRTNYNLYILAGKVWRLCIKNMQLKLHAILLLNRFKYLILI